MVVCLCQWPMLIVANEESADGVKRRLGGRRVVRGCHGRIVLRFP